MNINALELLKAHREKTGCEASSATLNTLCDLWKCDVCGSALPENMTPKYVVPGLVDSEEGTIVEKLEVSDNADFVKDSCYSCGRTPWDEGELLDHIPCQLCVRACNNAGSEEDLQDQYYCGICYSCGHTPLGEGLSLTSDACNRCGHHGLGSEDMFLSIRGFTHKVDGVVKRGLPNEPNVTDDEVADFISEEVINGNIPNLLGKAEEATKHDQSKPRYDLLPADALHSVVEVLTHGAEEYGDRNWEKGMKWTRLFGAVMRHMWAWMRGESFDPETGLPHTAHAACGCLFLTAYLLRKDKHSVVGEVDHLKMSEFDDRPIAQLLKSLQDKTTNHV